MQIPALLSMPQGAGAAHVPSPASKIQHAASEFEALLIQQMLRSSREAVSSDSAGDDDSGNPNSSLLDLGEQQFAQSLANSGGLGIAKMVVAGLSKNANR
jgi:Rod binding domain-containing protein